jgi:hypothetical protein
MGRGRGPAIDQTGRRRILVYNMEDNRAYACAYRFVSARCLLLQFAATTIRVICSALQCRTACFSSSSRTFNPKVAGSNPARPMRFAGILSTDRRAARTYVCTRTRPGETIRARSPAASCGVLQFGSARFSSSMGSRYPIARQRRAAAPLEPWDPRRTPACHAGGGGFESRRSRRKTCKSA